MKSLTGPAMTATLDRLVRENLETDAELERQQRRERNEMIYLDAIRKFWRETEKASR